MKCLIYDSSLRFSRAIYGTLSLIAFLIQSQWLVLATSALMILGIFTISLNIPYQFHNLISKIIFKKDLKKVKKEKQELSFACGMGGFVLFLSFFLLYSGKFINFAWSLVLVMSLLMFLASFAGVCVASLIYASSRKIFKK